MTTRSVARAPRLRLLALLLVLLAPTGAWGAEEFALECDVVAGIGSLRLSAPEGVEVRGHALDRRTWVFEIQDPSLMGLRPGPATCVSVSAVRVLPGYLLGTRTSRIVISHEGATPRSYSSSGRHRLTWLPEQRRVIARSEPVREPAPTASLPGRDDSQQRRLEAELEAQRQENARLRERLIEDPPRGEPAPAAMAPVPSKVQRKQRAKAEKRARNEAQRQEQRARKQARRGAATADAAARPSAVQEEPPAPAETAGAERPLEPVASAAKPAATPRAMPSDYVAFPSASMLVVTIATDVKDGPGRRYETLRRLVAGERVGVTGRAGDWYRVGDGEGWAFATYLAPPAAEGAAASQVGVVQDVTVPVHEGPGGHHAVVAELYRGQQVVIDELIGDWAHVRNGGWVHRSALGQLTPSPRRSK